MEKYDITFTVETIRDQQRPYGDTYREYIVESTQDIQKIEKFCTNILLHAISKAEFDALPTEKPEDFGNHFATYYTELKVLHKVEFLGDGKNKVSYKCVIPSCS